MLCTTIILYTNTIYYTNTYNILTTVHYTLYNTLHNTLHPPCPHTPPHPPGFANRNGWAFQLLKPSSKTNRPAGFTHYKHNFLDKRTLGFLKRDGQKTKIFAAPGWGSSNFFMPLTYHGEGEVEQHGPTVAVAK
jgi:hypothetical protein